MEMEAKGTAITPPLRDTWLIRQRKQGQIELSCEQEREGEETDGANALQKGTETNGEKLANRISTCRIRG